MRFENRTSVIAFAIGVTSCLIAFIVIIYEFPSHSNTPGYFITLAGIAMIVFMFSNIPQESNEKSHKAIKKNETAPSSFEKDNPHNMSTTITMDEGVFDIIAKGGPRDDYPGVDVEFIRPNFNGTNPRVLFELTPENELRCLIWANPDQEDYSRKISFGTIQTTDTKENTHDDGNTAQ